VSKLVCKPVLCLLESAIGYNGIVEPELIRKLLEVHKGHAIISLHKDTGVSDCFGKYNSFWYMV